MICVFLNRGVVKYCIALIYPNVPVILLESLRQLCVSTERILNKKKFIF